MCKTILGHQEFAVKKKRAGEETISQETVQLEDVLSNHGPVSLKG
jgi:hypothetical protein